MNEKFEGAPRPQESKTNLPEGFEATTIEDMLRQLKGNHDIQEKAFGRTFTEEEFDKRFPGNSITAQDLNLLAPVLGFELPTEEKVRAMTKKSEQGKEIADKTIILSPGEQQNLILGITKLFVESNIDGVAAYDLNQIFKQLTGKDHPNYKGDWSPSQDPFGIKK